MRKNCLPTGFEPVTYGILPVQITVKNILIDLLLELFIFPIIMWQAAVSFVL